MKSPITQRPTVLRVPQRASGGQARPSDGVDFFYVWHQPPTDEFPTVGEASFEVERIEVNERRLAICTTKNVDEDRLLVTCRDERLSELVGQRVRVGATFKVKAPKRAHRIHLSVPVPAHGVVMACDYGNTDVRHVKAIDMFVSAAKPDIREFPADSRPDRVEVRLHGWALPRGGVVFVWHLKQEQDAHFNTLLADPGQ